MSFLCLDNYFAALFFVVLFLFVNMANSGSGAILITVLTIGSVFCIAAFGTFAVANIIFARCFSIFTHDYLDSPALKLYTGLMILLIVTVSEMTSAISSMGLYAKGASSKIPFPIQLE